MTNDFLNFPEETCTQHGKADVDGGHFSAECLISFFFLNIDVLDGSRLTASKLMLTSPRLQALQALFGA